MANPFQIYQKPPKIKVSPKSINDFLAEEGVMPPKENKGFFGIALSAKRINGWLFFMFLGILLIFLKSGYLQTVKGAYYRQLAEGNRIRVLEIKASRGLIYDCRQIPLVKNNQNFILALISVDLPKDKIMLNDLISWLVRILNRDLKSLDLDKQLKEKISKIIEQAEPYSYQPMIIAENLSYEQAVLTKIAGADFPGIALIIGSSREYLKNQEIPSLSHLLGYLGKISEADFKNYPAADYSLTDDLGRTGLELNYESILKGQKGKAQVEVDALGVRKEVLSYQTAKAGSDLFLSLDLDIQKYLERSLTRVLNGYNKKRGVAIALNPNNGEIFGLVSWPSFNSNDFIKGIEADKLQALMNNEDNPLFNRAISGTYPPGSTIKPVLAAAALQEKIITPQTTFLSTGGIAVGKRWFFPDWKIGGHGLTNIYKALAESVNTFFYIIGGGYKDIKGLGIDRLAEYYQLAGAGKKLGIDLPGEAAGLMPREKWKKETKGEDWYIGDTYHLAIGQGDLLVTPLQVVSWTAMVANGGTLYQPHLVKAIADPATGKNFVVPPKVLAANFFDAKNLEIVKQGMRQVVTVGSATSLSDLLIKVAGKTGTAQWSSKKAPHAWFTGFAPLDQPEIVITVLIEEGGEGSKIAVAVAKEFLAWWVSQQ